MGKWEQNKQGLWLSYDAVVQSKRRVQQKVNNQSEDFILKGRDRDKVLSEGRKHIRPRRIKEKSSRKEGADFSIFEGGVHGDC